MSWQDTLQKLSHRQVREIVGLCSGAALLIAVAVTLSGNTPFLSTPLKLALNENSQAAATVYTKPGGEVSCNAGDVMVGVSVRADGSNYLTAYCSKLAELSGPNTILTGSVHSTYYRPGGGTDCNNVGVMVGGYTNGTFTDTSYCRGITSSSASVTVALGKDYVNVGSKPGAGVVFCTGNDVLTGFHRGSTQLLLIHCSPIIVTLAYPPILTITGNGTNPTTVTVGQSVNILSTFVAGTDDTLTKTALNDYQSNALPGVAWTPPTSKTYVFTPTAPGPYLFYPAVQTASYPTWNNYDKSLTVTVVAACPNGSGPVGACASCNNGFHLDNTGQCIANPSPTCADPHAANPPTCSCVYPYTGPNGGPCALVTTCADPHAVAPLCNTCVNPYIMQSGTCVLPPPTISLSAAQSRVSKGTPARLSWTVSNLTGDPTVQCAIASLPGGVFSSVMPAGTKPMWSGSNVATNPINGTTIFTLSCTGATPVSKTVTIVPSIIEI